MLALCHSPRKRTRPKQHYLRFLSPPSARPKYRASFSRVIRRFAEQHEDEIGTKKTLVMPPERVTTREDLIEWYKKLGQIYEDIGYHLSNMQLGRNDGAGVVARSRCLSSAAVEMYP
jgi:hypothetical protein